jgi:hypothetical protein
MKRLVVTVALLLVAAACGGNSPETSDAPAATTPAGDALDIRLSSPDQPRLGDNTFEITVTEGSRPVTDADVTLELFMAAMPSMNMPEMRTNVPLTHGGGGRYRGTASVTMGGAWDANVMVMRGDQHLGNKTITIIAK